MFGTAFALGMLEIRFPFVFNVYVVIVLNLVRLTRGRLDFFKLPC
jgi:hypothetical protein